MRILLTIILEFDGFFKHSHPRVIQEQKWQRRKNVTLDDVEYRTAQIMPGFKEQIYA
jgi:hypothetical protein